MAFVLMPMQAVLNYRRKSVVGLSFEYQLFNIVGFSCYATYNLMMRYSEEVQQAYRDSHDGKYDCTLNVLSDSQQQQSPKCGRLFCYSWLDFDHCDCHSNLSV